MPTNSVVFARCYFADVMRDEQLENVGLYGFGDASKRPTLPRFIWLVKRQLDTHLSY